MSGFLLVPAVSISATGPFRASDNLPPGVIYSYFISMLVVIIVETTVIPGFPIASFLLSSTLRN